MTKARNDERWVKSEVEPDEFDGGNAEHGAAKLVYGSRYRVKVISEVQSYRQNALVPGCCDPSLPSLASNCSETNSAEAANRPEPEMQSGIASRSDLRFPQMRVVLCGSFVAREQSEDRRS